MSTPWKTSPLGAALQRVLEQQGMTRKIREQEVLLRWEELVGTAIANHAQAQRLHKGVLWVEVTDAAWRQELQLMRTELIRRINTSLGDDIVTELRLR
ncbi:DUF721 domain-containing protein [bacterium]|nr:DUF721 domain-containing protein [bacterium]